MSSESSICPYTEVGRGQHEATPARSVLNEEIANSGAQPLRAASLCGEGAWSPRGHAHRFGFERGSGRGRCGRKCAWPARDTPAPYVCPYMENTEGAWSEPGHAHLVRLVRGSGRVQLGTCSLPIHFLIWKRGRGYEATPRSLTRLTRGSGRGQLGTRPLFAWLHTSRGRGHPKPRPPANTLPARGRGHRGDRFRPA